MTSNAALTVPEPWEALIAENSLQDAQVVPLASDWAARRYYRVNHRHGAAVLMVCQDELNKSQIPTFDRIARMLGTQGFSTPDILASNPAEGLMLLSDFGDVSFADAMQSGRESAQTLYKLAGEVLAGFQQMDQAEWSFLPKFADTGVAKGHRRVVDWYVPAYRNQLNSADMLADYQAAMRAIEASLPAIPESFIHIDFHVENLMWLPQREGIQKCGVLDFQGAAWGPCIYDLTNLLRDNRRLVDKDIQDAVLKTFLSSFPADQHEALLGWYRVYTVQFHFRVIGQVLKLALHNKRDSLLAFIPRLSNYLAEELQHPMFAELARLFAEWGIDFNKPLTPPDMTQLARVIAEDAF